MRSMRNCTTLKDSDRDLLLKCKKAIADIDPDVQMILYGSRARGDSNNESDYDLLLIGEKKASLNYEDLLREAIYPVELESGAVLTVMYYEKKQWNSSLFKDMPFHVNVSREGISI